jgi:thioredoxin 1
VVDEHHFSEEVLESDTPVLAAFLASWSQPCQIMNAVLDQLTDICGARLKIVKIEADDCLCLSLLYEIQSIPTLILFRQGRICFRIVGTATPRAVMKEIQSHFANLKHTH